MTKVVILAAGKGERMGCVDTPKVMLPFLEKPIIEYVVEAAKKSGIDKKPILVVGFCGQKVKDYFGDTCLYTEQTEQKGTGHAVLCAKEAAGDAENILVLNGDHPLTNAETIKKLAELHKDSGATLTFLTAVVPDFERWRKIFDGFGRVLRNGKGELVKIVERKDASEIEQKITECNPTFYCFKSDWLWPHLTLLKNENAQGEYYLTDLLEMAIKEKVKISHGSISPEECVGINTPEELKQAEEIYLKRMPK
jgi:bifunctional UDP-N-acetylglucosamine pyrophosphorylase/glucosamine-1-phosphate N-acetyltransferase